MNMIRREVMNNIMSIFLILEERKVYLEFSEQNRLDKKIEDKMFSYICIRIPLKF